MDEIKIESDTNKQYTVLEDSSLQTLINRVNEYIEWGWQPLGGICRDRYWYQAMTKPKGGK